MNLGAAIDVAVGNAFDPRPVLIVTGLVQEARIAAGPGMTVICSSSNPRQLRALLAGFDPSTVRGVISFGVAGGLEPDLGEPWPVVALCVQRVDQGSPGGDVLGNGAMTPHGRRSSSGKIAQRS